MHTSHIVTAIAFTTLDLGNQIDVPSPRLIGAATFVGHVGNGSVSFALDAAVLSAQDPADTVLSWLDRRLEGDHTTLVGFDLHRHMPLLKAMPLAQWSPAIRALSGRDRTVIDMKATEDGEAGSLHTCCSALGVPCAKPDRASDFTAWCTGEAGRIVHDLELDVIAIWRLAMYQLAARTSLGARVNRVIEGHLATWLRHADFPAAAIHLSTLVPTAH